MKYLPFLRPIDLVGITPLGWVQVGVWCGAKQHVPTAPRLVLMSSVLFQAIFILGLLLMVLGTYVNLYEADTKSAAKVSELNVLPPQNLDRIPDLVKDELVVNVAAPEVEGKPAQEKEKEIVEPGD